MRQLYAFDANESTRRLAEDGVSTGLTNTHTASGFSVLYHVFVRKQCILCSALRHKSYLTLSYMLHRFENLELPETFAHAALLGCASPFLSLLVRNYCKTELVYNGSDVE